MIFAIFVWRCIYATSLQIYKFIADKRAILCHETRDLTSRSLILDEALPKLGYRDRISSIVSPVTSEISSNGYPFSIIFLAVSILPFARPLLYEVVAIL